MTRSSRGPAWLVVVDVQAVFGVPPSPWASPDLPAALPRIEALIAEYDGRTVLTRFEPPRPPAEPEGSWVDYYRRWPFALDPGTSYDLLLDPGDAPVVTRPTMSKWGPELLAATQGSTDLVLCGVSTDCCVLSTALAAADAGAWVRVEATACAGASREDHLRALACLEAYAPQIEVAREPARH